MLDKDLNSRENPAACKMLTMVNGRPIYSQVRQLRGWGAKLWVGGIFVSESQRCPQVARR